MAQRTPHTPSEARNCPNHHTIGLFGDLRGTRCRSGCQRAATTLLPILFLLTASCIHTTHVTTLSGGRGYKMAMPTPAVTTTVADHDACRVAFLPFAIRPTASRVDVDAAYLTSKLQAFTASMRTLAGCKIVGPDEAQSELAKAGLVRDFAQALRDAESSGLLDEAVFRSVGTALHVDTIVHGRVASMAVDLGHDRFRGGQIEFHVISGKTGRAVKVVRTAGQAVEYDTRQTEQHTETSVGLIGGASAETRGAHFDYRTTGLTLMAATEHLLRNALAAIQPGGLARTGGGSPAREPVVGAALRDKLRAARERQEANRSQPEPEAPKSKAALYPHCVKLCEQRMGLQFPHADGKARRARLACVLACSKPANDAYRTCLAVASTADAVGRCKPEN